MHKSVFTNLKISQKILGLLEIFVLNGRRHYILSTTNATLFPPFQLLTIDLRDQNQQAI